MKTPSQDMTQPDNQALLTEDKESLSLMAERIREIGQRTEELHQLLTRYATTLDNEGLRQQLETLESWMKVNAENLNMTVRIFEMGPAWLEELLQRLNTAIEELEHMGGSANPQADRDQRAESQELRQVWSGVSNVLESMSKLFNNNSGTTGRS